MLYLYSHKFSLSPKYTQGGIYKYSSCGLTLFRILISNRRCCIRFWFCNTVITTTCHPTNYFWNNRFCFSIFTCINMNAKTIFGIIKTCFMNSSVKLYLYNCYNVTIPASTSFCKDIKIPNFAWFHVRPPWK